MYQNVTIQLMLLIHGLKLKKIEEIMRKLLYYDYFYYFNIFISVVLLKKNDIINHTVKIL